MPEDDESVEDISMTVKEITKVEKIKAKKALENPSNTYPVACPDCGCDYLIPLYKLNFTKSYAGNRLTVTWPSKEDNGDTALVACPVCADIIRVTPEGKIEKTHGKWGVKKNKK